MADKDTPLMQQTQEEMQKCQLNTDETTQQTQEPIKSDPEVKRRVVIAVDGGKPSEYAFEWYVKEMKRDGDQVDLVYACEISAKVLQLISDKSDDKEQTEAVLKSEKKSNREKIDRIQQMLDSAKLPKAKVCPVSTSKPGAGVVKFAEENSADVIICGTRGLGTVTRTFKGSVSDYILHHSDVPVIVARKD